MQQQDVIIIGSGVAGISAAIKFQEQQPELKIKILEAMDRPCGRVYTTEDGADLGGSWIHQWYNSNNSLRKLVEKYNIDCLDEQYQEEFYDQVTRERVSDEMSKKAEQNLQDIFQISVKKANQLKNDISIYDCVKEELQQINDSQDQVYKRVFYQYLSQCLNNEAATLDQLSAKMGVGNLEVETDLETMENLDSQESKSYTSSYDKLVKNGLGAMFKKISETLDIELQKEVQIIKKVENQQQQQQQYKYEITVLDLQTQQQKIYYTNYVIVTCSINVLKSNMITFQPQISQQKQNSIQKLGLGQANKVVLEFERCFWSEQVHAICMAQNVENPGEFPIFYSAKPGNNRNILMALISDTYSEQSEQMQKQELVNLALSKLKSVYMHNNQSLTNDDFILKNSWVTRWKENKYTQGSYTYFAVGSSHRDANELLQAEHDQTLYFAGEACMAEFLGTANSACVSGEIQAQNIMNQISKNIVNQINNLNVEIV